MRFGSLQPVYKLRCLQLHSTIHTATHQQPRWSSMTFEHGVKHFLGYCQLVKTWKQPAACLRTSDALITCSRFWNGDVYSSSKHIFHALISARGRKGPGIQCSTFAWWLYLKDIRSFPFPVPSAIWSFTHFSLGHRSPYWPCFWGHPGSLWTDSLGGTR